MWQHSQRPPDQFILRIQLNCQSGEKRSTRPPGSSGASIKSLFYFDLPPQQTAGAVTEADAVSTNAGRSGGQGCFHGMLNYSDFGWLLLLLFF